MNLWHYLGQFINLNDLVFTFSKSRMRTQEHGVKSLFKVNYKKTKAKFYSLKTSGFLMFSSSYGGFIVNVEQVSHDIFLMFVPLILNKQLPTGESIHTCRKI